MTKEEFRRLAQSGLLFLDGATGSNLQKQGMPVGVCPELWITEHEEIMSGLQKAYLEAGTNILYAPTFTANRIKLKEFDLEDRIEELNHKLVEISKRAADGKALVAGDLTMTGQQLKPMGPLDFEELIDVYKEQIRYLTEAGADLLVVETMMSLQESRAALIAAKETCPDIPVMVTMTFESDGRSLFGTDAATAAIVLSSLGADAVGANCSTGPDQMAEVIRRMAKVTDIPIIAKPNAGLPSLDEKGQTVYDMGPEEFGADMELLLDAGAQILGGCCGTTPEHIRKMTHRLAGRPVLDVNMGMSGIDEKAMMLQALEEVAGVTKLPLSIDSSHVDVQEEALRRYPGRALINSISLESEKFEKLLPLAKKYGAMFVLLPLSDEGLPKNLNEKISIIEKIVARALELGMKKTDIIVDGLVATVGANKQAALETLETIRYCHRNGLATTCGLSNISFGLPERSCVNSAFLTMAIASGLTMAIANPSQDILVGAAFASDLLLNKEDSDIRYIEFSGQAKERREEADAKKEALLRQSLQASEGSTVTANQPGNTEVQDGATRQKAAGTKTPQQQAAERVREAVLKGKRKIAEDLTKKALEAGNSPQELLHGQLLPAINEVGELFDKGKYFLPQLIASAETMKLCIGILEPLLLQEQTSEKMPVVVIATVAGDIHDIGKNLVALMLKNYGFQVIDLGKDVPKEKIIEATIEHNAQIIALSALMTTTMQEMRNVVEYAKEKGVTAKIMIGGAVITQDYADEIHADGYSRDAADAVRLAKRLVGMQE